MGKLKIDLIQMHLRHNLKKALEKIVDIEQVVDESDFFYEWKYHPERKPLKGCLHISHFYDKNIKWKY